MSHVLIYVIGERRNARRPVGSDMVKARRLDEKQSGSRRGGSGLETDGTIHCKVGRSKEARLSPSTPYFKAIHSASRSEAFQIQFRKSSDASSAKTFQHSVT